MNSLLHTTDQDYPIITQLQQYTCKNTILLHKHIHRQWGGNFLVFFGWGHQSNVIQYLQRCIEMHHFHSKIKIFPGKGTFLHWYPDPSTSVLTELHVSKSGYASAHNSKSANPIPTSVEYNATFQVLHSLL